VSLPQLSFDLFYFSGRFCPQDSLLLIPCPLYEVAISLLRLNQQHF
jgi:hypothetical protein